MSIVISGTDGITPLKATNGSASAPSVTGTDADSGLFFGTNEVNIATGGTERLTVDSSGNVAIGDGTAGGKLHVRQDQNTTSTGTFTQPHIKLENLSTTNTTGFTGIAYAGSVDPDYGWTAGVNRNSSGSDTAFIFRHHNNSAVGTEHMRITNTGDLLVDTTSIYSASSSSATGHVIAAGGVTLHYRSNGTPVYIGRQTNDGTLIDFRQAGSQEGTISVSGSTVSYNGGHLSRWSQLANNAERTEILRGSVLSNLNEMCEWGEEDNEQLNRMQVSTVEGDPNVSGVFQAWDDDDDTYTNDFYCAMTGDFVIRIAQGTTVARGDLLMSAGDGTAKPQDDDIVRSKTIAKVTSTNVSCTYDDGSYCVPCVLMAC